MKELIIVGAGGLGREILQWIKDINKVELKWIVKGFIDDSSNPLKEKECSHTVLGTIKDWLPGDNEVFACAIANPEHKEQAVHNLKARGAVFISVIHPTAIIGEHNNIGEGLVMYPNARITVNVQVGDFVTLLSSGIGHDVQIGDFSTISSYCAVTGGAFLGRKVFLGSHATVIPNVSVGDNVYIGAGSVVITNIQPSIRVMGNPARKFLP